MSPQTFIFLGSSGSGKGTQLENVQHFLATHDSDHEIRTLGMGDAFRTFWGKEGYTPERSREILDAGGLQPSFLQVHIWTQFLIDHLSPDAHLLIEGTPRRIEDARALDGAFKFYDRPQPTVVYLKVSREWAKKRVYERVLRAQTESARVNPMRIGEDSDEEKVNRRLDWFETYALPAIDFFRDKPEYTFIEVDGEQSISNVEEEIFRHIHNKIL